MFEFMKRHPQPFPNVTCSKQDFWLVKCFKRALLCMFLLRYLLEMKAQKSWNKFLHADIYFNKRTVQRYGRIDKELWRHSTSFSSLPSTYNPNAKEAPKKRKLIVIDSDQSDSSVVRYILFIPHICFLSHIYALFPTYICVSSKLGTIFPCSRFVHVRGRW